MITVNLERQGYTCSSAADMHSIGEAAVAFSPTLAIVDDSRIAADEALAELTKAGYGHVIRLSDQTTKPPFTLTLP